MKKATKCVFVILILSSFSFIIAMARENISLRAEVAQYKIKLEDEALKSKHPVVNIEGVTYVPLRDFAQQADMKVCWNGTGEKSINLYGSEIDEKYLKDLKILGLSDWSSMDIKRMDYIEASQEETTIFADIEVGKEVFSKNDEFKGAAIQANTPEWKFILEKEMPSHNCEIRKDGIEIYKKFSVYYNEKNGWSTPYPIYILVDKNTLENNVRVVMYATVPDTFQ
jgi:hypothetical protein